MKNIRFWRIIANILFYIFYVLIISIIFSFSFPILLQLFWKVIINSWDPIFDKIQYTIFILVLIITIIFRKKFYLPIFIDEESNKEEIIKKEIKKEKKYFSFDDEVLVKNNSWLDIKVGREIK